MLACSLSTPNRDSWGGGAARLCRDGALRWPLLAVLFWLSSPASAAVTLIAPGSGSSWRYEDNGRAPPADWREPGFDDSNWKRGPAPLGFGEPEVATVVDAGGDDAAKPLATYFRQEINVPETSSLRELLVLLRVDDGAVVYLNGVELLRENLPAGDIDSRTTAEIRVEADDESRVHRFVVPATGLRNGRNVLSAEVHQFNPSSSDLFLDLLVTGYGEGEAPQPVSIPAAAREVALAYRQRHRLDAGVLIPDGFADGGRRMDVSATGEVATDREVIVVDRRHDAALLPHLEFARSEFIAGLQPLARARFLALYVDLQCSPASGRRDADARVAWLEAEYEDRRLPLSGSIGSGVCRHRALLFKLLGDEAGLRVALARGNLAGGGAHAWNELRLEGDDLRIVDCMNPRGGVDFIRATDEEAQEYLTVDDEPYYPVGDVGK